MKATKKLIPALAMLIVAAVVMSSASFAWFTMSRQVTANGMNVTVTAPNNLLIKETAAADATYASSTSITNAADVINPASSADGLNFYYVSNNTGVNVNGSTKDAETTLAKAGALDTGYYIDFKYTVKTEGSTPVKVAVKDVQVTRNSGGTADGAKAVRAAVIDGTGAALLDVAKPDVVLWGINQLADETTASGNYFTDGQAVSAVKAAGEAVTTSAVNFAAINGTATDNEIFTVPVGTPTAITIRVWVEGESENCVVADASQLNFNISVVLRDVTYTA